MPLVDDGLPFRLKDGILPRFSYKKESERGRELVSDVISRLTHLRQGLTSEKDFLLIRSL